MIILRYQLMNSQVFNLDKRMPEALL
jgi:hypothetical protein